MWGSRSAAFVCQAASCYGYACCAASAGSQHYTARCCSVTVQLLWLLRCVSACCILCCMLVGNWGAAASTLTCTPTGAVAAATAQQTQLFSQLCMHSNSSASCSSSAGLGKVALRSGACPCHAAETVPVLSLFSAHVAFSASYTVTENACSSSYQMAAEPFRRSTMSTTQEAAQL
jgi:hypothetical protein